MSTLDLQGLQAAFQAALLRPRTPAGEGGAFLLTGDGYSRARRLAIYQNGYKDRLTECLTADFPALKALMGEELFGFFADAYIDVRPSRSPSLYDLSAGFADFLIETQRHAPEGVDLALPVDLARVERARLVASRAAGPEDRAEASAFEFLGFGALAVPETVLPLTLSYPLLDFVEALDRGEESPTVPEAAPCLLVTARRHYRVFLHTLEPWQYALLMALKAGADASASIAEACAAIGEGEAALQAKLIVWAPTARLQGLLM